jgi:hypothetical protein
MCQGTAPDMAVRTSWRLSGGLGKATDDESLEAEGRSDQAKGNLKDAGEKVKDAFKSNARIQQFGCEPPPRSFQRSVGTLGSAEHRPTAEPRITVPCGRRNDL